MLRRNLCLLTVLLSACSAETVQRGDEALVPIELTTTVAMAPDADMAQAASRAATRAANGLAATQLPEGELFHVFFEGNATTVTNLTYRADGSGGVTVPDGTAPFFTFDGAATTLHAYHGTDATTGSQVTNSLNFFTVAADQTSDAAYLKSDLMYAQTTLTKQGTLVSGTLAFEHRMAKLVVSITGSPDVGYIQSVRLVGGNRTVSISDATTCTLGTTLSDPLSEASPLLIFDDTVTPAVSVSEQCALIPPQIIGGKFLQVVTDKGTVTYSLTDKPFVAGKTYVIHLYMSASVIDMATVALGDWTDGWVEEMFNYGGARVVKDQVETVTMTSLSTTIEWANMNLGASRETDYGIYFAWGETEGFTGDARTYKPPYYLLGDGASKKEDLKYYKYVPAEYAAKWCGEGDPDGLTRLLPEDDAVQMIWGNGWRMPTKDELQSLIDTFTDTEHFTWTWYDVADGGYKGSGVAGYGIYDKAADATLFFPASGYLGNSNWRYVGTDALYWSSDMTLEDSPPGAAYILRLRENVGSGASTIYKDPRIDSAWRYCGLTVRPVRTITQ